MQFTFAMIEADWTPDQLQPRHRRRRRWRAVGILGRFRATGAEGRERIGREESGGGGNGGAKKATTKDLVKKKVKKQKGDDGKKN